jgi:hypothetical protein
MLHGLPVCGRVPARPLVPAHRPRLHRPLFAQRRPPPAACPHAAMGSHCAPALRRPRSAPMAGWRDPTAFLQSPARGARPSPATVGRAVAVAAPGPRGEVGAAGTDGSIGGCLGSRVRAVFSGSMRHARTDVEAPSMLQMQTLFADGRRAAGRANRARALPRGARAPPSAPGAVRNFGACRSCSSSMPTRKARATARAEPQRREPQQ